MLNSPQCLYRTNTFAQLFLRQMKHLPSPCYDLTYTVDLTFTVQIHIFIHKYRNFNAVMSGICISINRALAQFSKYLSSACNVMRDHSVLQNRDSAVTRMKRVIKYHRIRVRENITNVSTMFVKYVDFNNVDLKESEPYYHDFTILKDYEYEMPSICVNKRIEFLQHGYEIVAPVDYVNKVILAREELYD